MQRFTFHEQTDRLSHDSAFPKHFEIDYRYLFKKHMRIYTCIYMKIQYQFDFMLVDMHVPLQSMCSARIYINLATAKGAKNL